MLNDLLRYEVEHGDPMRSVVAMHEYSVWLPWFPHLQWLGYLEKDHAAVRRKALRCCTGPIAVAERAGTARMLERLQEAVTPDLVDVELAWDRFVDLVAEDDRAAPRRFRFLRESVNICSSFGPDREGSPTSVTLSPRVWIRDHPDLLLQCIGALEQRSSALKLPDGRSGQVVEELLRIMHGRGPDLKAAEYLAILAQRCPERTACPPNTRRTNVGLWWDGHGFADQSAKNLVTTARKIFRSSSRTPEGDEQLRADGRE